MAASSSSMSSSLSSSIKGGGNASMSPKVEEMIVSLLYDSRDRLNPLRPAATTASSATTMSTTSSIKHLSIEDTNDDTDNDDNDNDDSDKEENKQSSFEDLSSHDKKREKRRFLKKIVECHNRHVLALRLNGVAASTDDDIAADAGTIGAGGSTSKGMNSSSTINKIGSSIRSTNTTTTSGAGGAGGAGDTTTSSAKVRIELTEAIYKKNKRLLPKKTTIPNPPPQNRAKRVRKRMTAIADGIKDQHVKQSSYHDPPPVMN